MEVYYIFSINRKIGSKLISTFTASLSTHVLKPSHICILIDNKWIFESTLETGVRIIRYRDWLKINTELKRIKCVQNWTMQNFKNILRQIKGKKYDYLGVCYLGYRILLNKLLKLRIPDKNLFNHEDSYFCCEAVGRMTNIDYTMTTPVQILTKLDI